MAFSLLTWASFALAIYLSTSLILLLRKRRSELEFAQAHGCLPAKVGITQLGFPFSLIRLFDFKTAADKKRYINFIYDEFCLYGPTHVYFALTGATVDILTSDPENIKTLLATSFHDFELGEERHAAFSPLLGDGIFTSDGKAWEHARALLRPQFTKDQIADLDDLEIHFQHLLAVLSPQEGEVVGLHKLFLSLTLDSATAFLFGKSLYSLRNKIPGTSGLTDFGYDQSTQFESDFDYCQDTLGFRLLIWDYRWFYNPKRLPVAIANIHRYVDQFIAGTLRDRKDEGVAKDEGRKYVFLAALAQDTQDPKVMRDQCLSALLAGRDTTASLLSWTFWLLSKHPQVWQRLREVILEDIGQQKPTYQQLKDCNYLKWVLNEALRLYPIVPLNFRYCKKNTTLPRGGGADGCAPIFVPAGACIFYSVYALHRNTAIYGKDADVFRPERWGDGKARGWQYIPFNGGPRICVGQQMALMTASYVVVRLLQHFERIEDADVDVDGIVKSNLGLTLSPANGTPVRLFRTRSM